MDLNALRLTAGELGNALASFPGMSASDDEALALAEVAKRAIEEFALAFEELSARVQALEGA
ncbi:hypothetical protein HLB44_22965 [Aquincola sp. S2]|uniref:Uncharacterized protein n=1 Tax=Pseudaquabacterium terrae TaxID=2732868 RepID=A0ABX2EML8_9BURK|nr:hypothetical protein [Aquabacterium terrae]NRF69871.1 hypothetical protein [Aquabacterium terrae]